MKYSKRTRDQAALICQVAASNPQWFDVVDFDPGNSCARGVRRESRQRGTAWIQNQLGATNDAYWLAFRMRESLLARTVETDAEAECRIRNGEAL